MKRCSLVIRTSLCKRQVHALEVQDRREQVSHVTSQGLASDDMCSTCTAWDRAAKAAAICTCHCAGAMSDHEDVLQTRCEHMPRPVLDRDDVERPRVPGGQQQRNMRREVHESFDVEAVRRGTTSTLQTKKCSSLCSDAILEHAWAALGFLPPKHLQMRWEIPCLCDMWVIQQGKSDFHSRQTYDGLRYNKLANIRCFTAQQYQETRWHPCTVFTKATIFTLLPLNVLHNAHTPCVTSPGDHAHVADLELDRLCRLPGFKIHLDGVVHLYKRRYSGRFMHPHHAQVLTFHATPANLTITQTHPPSQHKQLPPEPLNFSQVRYRGSKST